MWQYPTPAPPGLAPDGPPLLDTDEWNRTIDKFIALEVNATRNEVAHAVWHVMSSMPWSLSNTALLSGEVRRVLAACSKKQYELDKVRADLARQKKELDNQKLEVEAKQNKLDKQQKQIHKFEMWFLQVDLIERIERIGEDARLGPESETESEAESEADTEAELSDSAIAAGWRVLTAGSSMPIKPDASLQQDQSDLEQSAHGSANPPRYSADSWGIENDPSANITEIKDKSQNNPESIKTESTTKAESLGKDTPAYKSTYDGGHPSWTHFDAVARAATKSVNNGDKSGDHSGVRESTTWADPTVASRIPWADPTAAPKLQQDNHNVGCTCYLGDFGQPCSAKAHTRSLWHKALKSAKPAHKVKASEKRSVWDSTNKPANIDKGDKGDKHNSVGESAYHWHDNVPNPDEGVSTLVGTKVSDGQYKFDGSCALRPRYNDRPRRPSSGLRYLDELTNKSANDPQPGNAGESTNVAESIVPCTWTDDELTDDKLPDDKFTNDKLTDDKLTDIDVGESPSKFYGTWSFSEHSSDAENLTTLELPVVTPESSASGSRTRSHVSKGPYKKIKVKASIPEEEYKDWHKYEDPRYKGWTFAGIDEYDAAGQAW